MIRLVAVAAAALTGVLTIADSMTEISRDYVRLVLAMGAHD